MHQPVNAFHYASASGRIATFLMGAVIRLPYCCNRLQRVSWDRAGTYQAQLPAYAAMILARVSGCLAPPSFLPGYRWVPAACRAPASPALVASLALCLLFFQPLLGLALQKAGAQRRFCGQLTSSMLLIAALVLSHVWLNSDLLLITAGLRNPGHSNAHSFSSNFTMCNGFTRALSTVSPQCRCGPVTRPVAPTFPRAAPASKVSPTFASISERCP